MEDLPIVAFDFDGTMTVTDSFTAFLRWRTPPLRWALGGIRLIPATLAYLLHRDRGRIKVEASRVFLAGISRVTLEAEAARFAELHARRLLRPDAVAAFRRWSDQGVRRIIVTASPEIVVAPFARGLGADDLIGTQFAEDSKGRITGDFASPNCRGPEKVVRMRERYGAAMRLQAAYGDTSGDTEMLAIAEQPYYRVFTERP